MLPAPCSLPRKRSAFTLIELLVVIAIVIVLASMSLAVMGGVMASARKTEVRAMAQQIKAAISAYYAEYGIYPSNKTTDPSFYALITGTDTANNKRGIRFLDVPTKFLSTDNISAATPVSIQTPAKFYPSDRKPAREEFAIVTDGQSGGTGQDKPYDGKIKLPTDKVVPGTVAVYVPDPNAKKTGDAAWVGTW
jgi:type II secretory pathway pseudopilin PulG